MESVSVYLSRVERELSECNYFGFHCTQLAIDTAQRLVQEGKSPLIIRLGYKLDTLVDSIIPRKYPNTKWRYHDVCVTDEIDGGIVVWDPMIGRPLPLSSYFERGFGREFEFTEHISSAKIRKMLNIN